MKVFLLLRLIRLAMPILAALILSSCVSSGIKTVDRAPNAPTKGAIAFQINEGADFSIMREPVTVYITRAGEAKPLGFVGSDVKWAPAGYVTELHVAEAPGRQRYTYRYSTAGKDMVSIISPLAAAISPLNIQHQQGSLEIDVVANKKTPVVFSLGPKEIKGTLISKRLDPSQFKVVQGKPQ